MSKTGPDGMRVRIAAISNTEVVAAGKEALVAGTWDDVWTAVAAETSALTAQPMDAYRDARMRPDRPALEPETLPQTAGIEAYRSDPAGNDYVDSMIWPR